MKITMQKISERIMVAIAIAVLVMGLFWVKGFFYLGTVLTIAAAIALLLYFFPSLSKKWEKEEYELPEEGEENFYTPGDLKNEPEEKVDGKSFFSPAGDLDVEPEEKISLYMMAKDLEVFWTENEKAWEDAFKSENIPQTSSIIRAMEDIRLEYLEVAEVAINEGNFELAKDMLEQAEEMKQEIEEKLKKNAELIDKKEAEAKAAIEKAKAEEKAAKAKARAKKKEAEEKAKAEAELRARVASAKEPVIKK